MKTVVVHVSLFTIAEPVVSDGTTEHKDSEIEDAEAGHLVNR